MRDIERIDVLLELLREYWKQDDKQDLRLGQILSIIAQNKDVFYLEDTEVIKWLQRNVSK